MAVKKKIQTQDNYSLETFVENTVIVYDNEGKYSLLMHSYPEIKDDGTPPTFVGVNIWLTSESDFESEFDLKSKYFDYMLERGLNNGLVKYWDDSKKDNLELVTILPVYPYRKFIKYVNDFRAAEQKTYDDWFRVTKIVIIALAFCIFLLLVF